MRTVVVRVEGRVPLSTSHRRFSLGEMPWTSGWCNSTYGERSEAWLAAVRLGFWVERTRTL